MRANEISGKGLAPMKDITIRVPMNTHPYTITLIQQLASQLYSKPQPLTPDQLNVAINNAYLEKMRRLAIIYQNRKIWNAGNLVNKDEKWNAQHYGES